jgi:hypothetical protein
MMRLRSAAGGAPVSRLTSREKWNYEAELLRAIPATSVLPPSTTASSNSRSRSRRGAFGWTLTVSEYCRPAPRAT